MRILVDMDGVLCKWDEKFDWHILNTYAHVKGIPLAPDRTSFNFYDGQPAEVVQAINEIMNLEGFYAELEPFEGSIEALHEMVAEGHEVFLCTSPWTSNVTCASDKLRWAEKHLGAGWAKRTIITGDKTLVRGDILIDDKPEITGVAKPEWVQWHWSQPYNQWTDIPKLTDWADWRVILDDPRVAVNTDRAELLNLR